MKVQLVILIIIVLSIGVKIVCLNYFDIPSPDAKIYNIYAKSLVETGQLSGALHNIGFPFSLVFLQYFGADTMVSQKIFTVFLSSLIIPVFYLFLRNYFAVKYAIIGSLFIAFDPRIIQNSILGVTETLYLLLFVSSLVLLLRNNYWLAFLLGGIATVVRLEGLVLLPVMFLLAKKRPIPHFAVFFIPIILTAVFFVNETGQDNVTTKIEKETKMMQTIEKPVFIKQLLNSFIYLGWFTFPMFVFFIPTSFYFLGKQNIIKPYVLILCLGITASTGVWAYLDAHDTRYFFHMYPFLTILVLLTWQKFFPNSYKV